MSFGLKNKAEEAKAEENAHLLIQTALSNGIKLGKELANFMGQMQAESGSFIRMEERFNYSASRMVEVFHKQGLSLEKAQEIIRNGQESLANFLYGGKNNPTAKNLGNIHEGDGWKYRGRGFVQLTGRDNYRIFGKKVGLDLVNHPELAADRDNALKIAVAYWKDRVVNHHKGRHDELSIIRATHDLNNAGGNLDQREKNINKWIIRFNDGYLEKNHLITPPDKELPHNNKDQLNPQAINLYAQIETLCRDKAKKLGINWNQGMENTVYALTAAGFKNGLKQVTNLAISGNNINIADLSAGRHLYAQVNIKVAAETEIAQSIETINQIVQANEKTKINKQPQQTHQHSQRV